jgi:hypothetical protein
MVGEQVSHRHLHCIVLSLVSLIRCVAGVRGSRRLDSKAIVGSACSTAGDDRDDPDLGASSS